jgi:hypothetical protein
MIKSDNSRRYWPKPITDPLRHLSPENRNLKPGDKIRYFKRNAGSIWTKHLAIFESFGSKKNLKAWIIFDDERISVSVESIERLPGQ